MGVTGVPSSDTGSVFAFLFLYTDMSAHIERINTFKKLYSPSPRITYNHLVHADYYLEESQSTSFLFLC